MISHHPSGEHLLHYAAGALPQGASLVVAAHLNYCPACRAAAREAEAVGGALLEGETVEPMTADPATLALDDGFEARPAPAPVSGADIPSPLRPYIGDRLSQIRWRTFWPGMQTVRIACPEDRADIMLLRLRPGTGMPVHSHGGEELTLVLQGSYSDETGRYAVGDVALGNEDLLHRPLADEGAHCVCLTVIDSPLKFSSPLARLASRWLLR